MREENNTHVGQKLINLIDKYFVMDERDKRKALYHVASTHLQFTHWGQLLMILAPESGCGKTNLRDLIACLVQNARKCVDPSPSAIYGMITEGIDNGYFINPIMDEMGKYYNGKRDTSAMTTIISAGVRPGDPIPRTQWINGERKTELLETFGNKVLCGKRNETEGFFPDDCWRRAHVINLMKHNTDDKAKFITRTVQKECATLRNELEAWAEPRIQIAREMEPTWLLFSGSLYDKTETLFTHRPDVRFVGSRNYLYYGYYPFYPCTGGR